MSTFDKIEQIVTEKTFTATIPALSRKHIVPSIPASTARQILPLRVSGFNYLHLNHNLMVSIALSKLYPFSVPPTWRIHSFCSRSTALTPDRNII